MGSPPKSLFYEGLGGDRPAGRQGKIITERKNMLIGEYTHTIDPKKRLSLPSKFRRELGKKVVVTRGLDNCLFVYPINEWKKISEKLAGLGVGKADTRDQIQYSTNGFYFNANFSNRFFILQAVSISNFPVSKFGSQ